MTATKKSPDGRRESREQPGGVWSRKLARKQRRLYSRDTAIGHHNGSHAGQTASVWWRRSAFHCVYRAPLCHPETQSNSRVWRRSRGQVGEQTRPLLKQTSCVNAPFVIRCPFLFISCSSSPPSAHLGLGASPALCVERRQDIFA